MSRIVKWELTDGTYVTTVEVAEACGISTPAARYRLNNSNVREVVFKEKGKHYRGSKTGARMYTLDNGDVVNVHDICKRLGMTEGGARARLDASSDPELVYLKKSHRAHKQRDSEKLAKARLELDESKTRVIWGIRVEVKQPSRFATKLAPSASDIMRNKWHLDRDEYGFMNNGDDD